VRPPLHVHLVTRYLDDYAPGKPLPFDPTEIGADEFARQFQRLVDVATDAG
jgi:hypothetical protein